LSNRHRNPQSVGFDLQIACRTDFAVTPRKRRLVRPRNAVALLSLKRIHQMAHSLKKLSKERPTGEDIEQALLELATDGPRGAAVLGAALVEDVLQGCIEGRFVELSAVERDHLFSGTGPLSSFSAKTKLGFAMGIFGPRTRDDLDSVREIRNALAHAKRLFTFETPAIAAALRRLNCVSYRSDALTEEPKLLYADAIRAILIHLVGHLRAPGFPGHEFESSPGLD
jgi:hypothetical protein